MIRVAQIDEINTLNELIDLSARELGKIDYSPHEIEGAIQYIFGVDRELVQDKTYYVMEQEGTFIACGGWSRRKTLFGGDQCSVRENGFLNPKLDFAKIRAFFVHPSYARQGLGKKLLTYCEKQAKAYGFSKLEMMATLTGVKLYRNCGYQLIAPESFLLGNGESFKMFKMVKHLQE
ncbi:GNAT family acetyltransferase [Legionella wadsworthii]|uniref:GNAT family acetyltransferase n=1 Tax=Legionella wadsworthii TaxID=28088 RepID=A0A378LUJ5_9GAMM|nr:GNAT family N-acetyltransferase [Legionella wadsworthii]STY30043.1 GNAT family acetyltransferase [Legionella wadsworthii]